MEGNGAGAGSRFLIVSAALSGLLFFSFLGLRFHTAGPLIDGYVLVLLGAGVGCFLLPFARRIKIGSVLEFERELGDLKRDVEGVASQVTSIASSATSIAAVLSLQVHTAFQQNMTVMIADSVKQLARDVPGADRQEEPVMSEKRGPGGVYGVGRASSEIRAHLRDLIAQNRLGFPPNLLEAAPIEQMAGFLLAHEIIDPATAQSLAVFGSVDFVAASGGTLSDQQLPKADELARLLVRRLEELKKSNQKADTRLHPQ